VVGAAFQTEELAIDSDDLSWVVRAAIDASDTIEVYTNRRVDEIESVSNGYRVSGRHVEGRFSIEVDQIVNATWERRSALDSQMGISPELALLHRLKYRVIGSLPERMHGGPSATMVLGRYGDVVVRPNGTAFLSWYPVGLRGWSGEVEPPRDWDAPCRGEVDPATRDELSGAMIREIRRWYPGMEDVRPLLVDAGVIVAVGTTDVDDPGSTLHERTRIGVTSVGGYHTLETGKLTTAPLFAMEAARRVLENAGSGILLPVREDAMDGLVR
jgi:hypothetical protein